jgi:hypothetical protein
VITVNLLLTDDVMADERGSNAVSCDKASAGVVIECPACEVPFAPPSNPNEAAFLAGVHNDFEHGGGHLATVVPADTAAGVVEEPVAVVSGLGWAVAPSVYADARAQAVPYAGDQTATDRAWAARVDTAVQGMDVLDPDGLDTWMDTHAASSVPHLAEAGLVAAWETHVRGLYDPDVGHELADQSDLTDHAPPVLGDDADVDDWS